MSEFVRGFVIPDVADVHILYQRAITLARRVAELERRAGPLEGAAVGALAVLEGSYRTFQSNLRGAAQKAATTAVEDMRARLDATQVRAATDSAPHLRELLSARPLQIGGLETGAVGIADIKLLDRAINPYSRGYGTYWRAQEYGTGSDGIPSQVGRVIHGYFIGGGDQEPPDAQYSGGGGPHPVFVSDSSSSSLFGRGARGGFGGFGTISVEDRPRHFIRDGADQAKIVWRADIARAQADAISALARLP